MNYLKIPLVVLSCIALTGLLGFVSVGAHASEVQGSTALERGYRTGYSDGYTSGFRDGGDKAPRDYQGKDEYQRADRSYNNVWGPIEDYRDGYRQGFESGYGAGYDRREFDSTLPSGLRRRQQQNESPSSDTSSTTTNNSNTSTTPNNDSAPVNPVSTAPTPSVNASLAIPRNTILTLELLTPLSTDATHRDDRFQARVTQPAEYAGLIVEGRVTQVKRPGKVKGVAELQLSFEQIRSSDNRTAGLHAELLEVLPADGSEIAVDPEGGVKGRDSTKNDFTKVGAASGM